MHTGRVWYPHAVPCFLSTWSNGGLKQPPPRAPESGKQVCCLADRRVLADMILPGLFQGSAKCGEILSQVWEKKKNQNKIKMNP